MLDTLFENLSLGLIEDHAPRALLYTQCRRRNAQILLTQLQELLKNLNWDLDDVDEAIETEDTLTTLERCVADLENKDDIFAILKSLYLEAQV